MSVSSLFDKIDQGRKGKNIGLKTGIPKLDKYTGGIQKGRYTLVFGLSGSGKSSLAYDTVAQIDVLLFHHINLVVEMQVECL